MFRNAPPPNPQSKGIFGVSGFPTTFPHYRINPVDRFSARNGKHDFGGDFCLLIRIPRMFGEKTLAAQIASEFSVFPQPANTLASVPAGSMSEKCVMSDTPVQDPK